MMPFSIWPNQDPKTSKHQQSRLKPRKIKAGPVKRACNWVHIRRSQKQLIKELEYELYLAYSEVERRRHDRDFLRVDARLRFFTGLFVMIGFFLQGMFLDYVPIDGSSHVYGVHFAAAGACIAWLFWVWQYLRLDRFRARADRYLKRSVDGCIEQL